MVREGSLGERIPSLRLRKCKETARSSGGGEHCYQGMQEQRPGFAEGIGVGMPSGSGVQSIAYLMGSGES